MRDHRLAVVATLWAALAVFMLWLFAHAVAAVHAVRLQPVPAVRAGLDELAVPVTVYAAWWVTVVSAFAVLCVAMAVAIVWRRPREPIAWFVSVTLLALGTVNVPAVEALAVHRPDLELFATAGFQLVHASLALFLFTFPDGRFYPRWSAAVVVGLVAWLVLARGSVAQPVTDALFVALTVALVAGLVAQIVRYRRRSNPEERHQTRGVLLAVIFAVAMQIGAPLTEALPVVDRPGIGAALHDMLGVFAVTAGYSTIVIAIAAAVFRRRLWNLDAIVNRALVYAGLTAVMLAIYLAVVFTLGRSFTGPGAASGSLIAAGLVAVMFAPVRERLQRGVNRLMYGHRDEPYRVVADLAQQLEITTAPRDVMQSVADAVAMALRSPHVAVVVDHNGAEEVGAAAGRRPASGVDFVVPLLHHHQRVGELRVAPRGPQESFNPADKALLTDLARQAAAAIHAVRLTQELISSRERLVTAREEERRRLRRDLHDGLGPALASMTLQAETAGEMVARKPDVARDILSDLVQQLQASTADVRQLVYDLRPPALDDLGVGGALRTFITRTTSSRLRCRLELPEPMPPLSAAAEVAIYRIVQEAITNVLRHADAENCSVRISSDDDGVTVEVVDDGVGLRDDVEEGVGLRSMRERATELGGTCKIDGRPGVGTHIGVRLPHAPTAQVVL